MERLESIEDSVPAVALPRPSRRRLVLPVYVLLLTPVLALLILFYVIPFGANLLTSLTVDGHLSLGYYRQLLGDPYYLLVTARTLVLGVVVTLAAFALGYPAGYFLARTRSRFKPVFIFLVISPLVISVIIRTYGWLVLLGNQGVINTTLLRLGLIRQPLPLVFNWFGLVIALTHVLLPFMILAVAAVIEGIDPRLEESARVLGANRWQCFRLVTFPLSIEGVGAGATLVFMLTIGSFVTVLLLGGTGTMILPLLVYQQVMVTMNNNLAAATGSLLLLIAVILLYVQTRVFRIRGRG